MNVRDTMNCISSNDRLDDCVFQCKIYSAVFDAKGNGSYKNSYKVTLSG